MRLFTWMFRKTFPAPASIPERTEPTRPAPRDNGGLALSVAKAVHQFELIARTYGVKLWSSPTEHLRADLETMLRFDDLEGIRVELLGAQGQVVCEYAVSFGAGGVRSNLPDSARGVEVPVLVPGLVKGSRMVVSRRGGSDRYAGSLRLAWGPAASVPKSLGSTYASQHVAAITGGRQSARFHVSHDARRRFVVTQSGQRGFGFAKDLDSGVERVYVTAQQMPQGLPLRVGARFSGLLIQTPRGMQVRSLLAV